MSFPDPHRHAEVLIEQLGHEHARQVAHENAEHTTGSMRSYWRQVVIALEKPGESR